jgi:DNA-binding response OmpR family regulator
MCYPLNGSDLSPDRTPLEAGLGIFVALDKPDFVGRDALLTQKEADLLRLLCQKRNEVVRRAEVLEALWGKNDYFLGRSLDVFISRLRKYLSADSRLRIDNIHGIGFLFVCP